MLRRRSIAAVASCFLLTGPAALAEHPSAADVASSSCSGVPVRVGDDVHAVLNAHAEGDTFCFQPGVHRLASALRPKTGQKLVGEPGAVLNGSKPLTRFSREGNWWVASGQTQRLPQHGECIAGYTGCRYAEDVFLDGRALWQVTSLAEVASGRFYFDYARSRIYLADVPTGRQVETTVATGAVLGGPGRDRVTVRGLTIEKFGNLAQHGAVDTREGRGWLIEHNIIRLNHGQGLVANTGSVTRHNLITANGQQGVGGHGSDLLFQSNEISYNNTAGFSAGWSAGGSKWSHSTRLTVRDNYVHHNRGPGLWTDIDNIHTIYDANRVEHNTAAGIFHEISYNAVVRNNRVVGNGLVGQAWAYGAGIQIAHSPNVEVVGNVLSDNFNGITLIQQERGRGAYGPRQLDNVWVHHNQVTMDRGFTGLAQDIQDKSYFTSRSIRFENNDYRLVGGDRRFGWMDTLNSPQQWRSYGNDTNGTYTSQPKLPPGAEPQRLSGPSRFDTAVAISRDSFAEGSARAVVIARSGGFADALAGGPLAVALAGPLLLTPTEALHTTTARELQRVLPAGHVVYILGGPAAISAATEQAIRELGYKTRRIFGASRVETAIAVARTLGDPATLLITTGSHYADALAAGPAASRSGGAVLLSTPDRPHPSLSKYLTERPARVVFAVGGPAARAYPAATPVFGPTRDHTAVEVARRFFTEPALVGLARRDAFVDALTGGAHIGRLRGPMLLTSSHRLPDVTANYLREAADSIRRAYVYGGSTAVSDNVLRELRP